MRILQPYTGTFHLATLLEMRVLMAVADLAVVDPAVADRAVACQAAAVG